MPTPEVIHCSPEQFRRLMKKEIAFEIPEWASKEHRKLHLSLVNQFIEGTPVGNPDLWDPKSLPPPKGYRGGRARGNWQSSLASAPAGETGEIDRSGFPTKQKNKAAIAALKPFAKSWITNNVPYIVALNDGLPPGNQHSVQAPLLWIEAAIERTVR